MGLIYMMVQGTIIYILIKYDKVGRLHLPPYHYLSSLKRKRYSNIPY